MKITTLIIFLFSLMINAYPQSEDTPGSKSLDDVIVKETFEAGTEEEKLPVFLKADFSNLVEIKERIHWSSIPWKYEGEKPSVENFTGKLTAPEYTGISPQPAKVFYLNFEELSSWKIDIFTSDGQKFRTLSGEGNPPKFISWEGRGDDNSPITPGQSYAYSLTATDRAGNRRTFPGEAFSVNALYLKEKDELWVGLSNASIFSPDGYGLSYQAEDYATELVNFIYYFADKGTVNISSEHPQTDQFLAMVAKKLGKDIDFFKRETVVNPTGKCMVVRIK
jgi:hypothetical protein